MVEIIAEIAQGYEGDPNLALLLARAAVRAGADAVKLQLVYADDSATQDFPYYDFYRSLEMPFEAWKSVAEEVKGNNVKLYLDIGGERALREAVDLGVDGVKIHTTNFYNSSLIRSALDTMPLVYISFGGITIKELKEFLDYHKITSGEQVCLMYGFQAEPTPIDSNNLLRLGSLKKRFPGYRIGFMDHTEGDSDQAMTLALMVLPFGIHSIEKHISLDLTLKIEDYISALSPERFRLFVERIRRLEPALGTDNLELTPLEREYRYKSMKVIIARNKLKKGDIIKLEDLDLKCASYPSLPSSIHQLEKVVNRTLTVDVYPNQPITKDMLS